ncbi:uncharacterized protein LOC144609408 isoform X2 [Rhinoraja longicauda]
MGACESRKSFESTLALTVGGNDYQVDQPARLSAVEGGSVTLPCTFSYPAHLRPRGFDVAWSVGYYHGLTIFILSRAYTHREYEGRITFLGSPDHNHTASIRLDRLRMSDSGRYYCRVMILSERDVTVHSIWGTDLSVQAPTERPSVTVTVTLVVENTTPRGSPPWVPFVAGGGGLLLLLLGAGVVICICQRKRRRRRREVIKKQVPDDPPAVDKHLDQHQEDAADVPENYSPNVPVSQGDGSKEIVYAVVKVKESSTPRNVSHPEPKDLYAAVRFTPTTIRLPV